MPYQLWMEINRNRLRSNLLRLQAMGKKSGSRIMAVVKADAYGHGVDTVVSLSDTGLRSFGVASVSEGKQLREKGVKGEIFLLGGFFSEETEELFLHRLTPVISSMDELEHLSRSMALHRDCPRFHLKVDTGMGRMGILTSDVPEFLEQAKKRFPSLFLAGVMTHFSCAECDPEHTQRQYRDFVQLFPAACEDSGLVRHCCNSAGFLLFPEMRMDMARIGIALFGVSPTGDASLIRSSGLQPVMSLKTRVKFVKHLPACFPMGYGATYITPCPSRVAVLPVGYSQGIFRSLSNRMEVLIRGHRSRVAGTISMDQMMVDVTDIPAVEKGDEAVLIGEDGSDAISVEELANLAGTIPHEILCSLVRVKNKIFI